MEFRAPLPPELLTVLLDLGYEGPMGERSTGEGDQPV
jgi:hypothetical protein